MTQRRPAAIVALDSNDIRQLSKKLNERTEEKRHRFSAVSSDDIRVCLAHAKCEIAFDSGFKIASVPDEKSMKKVMNICSLLANVSLMPFLLLLGLRLI